MSPDYNDTMLWQVTSVVQCHSTAPGFPGRSDFLIWGDEVPPCSGMHRAFAVEGHGWEGFARTPDLVPGPGFVWP